MPLGPADDFGERLVQAILSAFNKGQLSSLMRFKGGMVLENWVNTESGLQKIVEELVILLAQNDDLDRLVALALAARPNNSQLKALAKEHDIAPAEQPAPAVAAEVAQGTVADFVAAAQKSQPSNDNLDAVAASVGAAAAAPSEALEALVARRSKLTNFARFRQRLGQPEARVCLVRTPGKVGTGFLVGPSLILTNYHVVEGLLRDEYGIDAVVCEFDFNGQDGDTDRVGLAGAPIASSPYSASDLTGIGQPNPGELDYALLPIARSLGEGARGHYQLDPLPRLISLGDFVFIAQHAGGQALQLAMGTITDFPGQALRIRYDVTTDHGSSGSPCLNAELDLIGLHHAAGSGEQPTYNQAVPLWLIGRDARDKGVMP